MEATVNCITRTTSLVLLLPFCLPYSLSLSLIAQCWPEIIWPVSCRSVPSLAVCILPELILWMAASRSDPQHIHNERWCPFLFPFFLFLSLLSIYYTCNCNYLSIIISPDFYLLSDFLFLLLPFCPPIKIASVMLSSQSFGLSSPSSSEKQPLRTSVKQLITWCDFGISFHCHEFIHDGHWSPLGISA